ncbi:hypothetical protein MFUM_1010066 [Methylacidiphilum fumariolicum SolV]|uniref:Uncharacterized protein n=1 Tax=Methylacidiphilum fumariolicum (strain SolV) TaxID=1156937 RepID=I0JVH3_METFB|nr:hypothetical protein MFUM_1010066 [Methylacidiphilum fumariolicum SolV]
MWMKRIASLFRTDISRKEKDIVIRKPIDRFLTITLDRLPFRNDDKDQESPIHETT